MSVAASCSGAWSRPPLAPRLTPDVVLLVFDGDKLSSVTGENAEKLLGPYVVFMGKYLCRTALNKPRLPLLIVVTKMDKMQAADTKATRRDVVRRTSAALPDDELDVHFRAQLHTRGVGPQHKGRRGGVQGGQAA